MFLSIVVLIIGLVILVKGADLLVSGASALAGLFRISELAIGLTVVAFGTSMPELVVNVFAASEGLPDIVFGNVIGSNNFNLFLILGLAGIIIPLLVKHSTVWKEIPISLVAVVLLFVLTNDVLLFSSNENILSRSDGFILIICFVLFILYVYFQMKTETDDNTSAVVVLSKWKIGIFITLGLIGLIVGGKMVVNSAVSIATAFGLSERIIGLTIIAAGTSLPELATSVVAAYRKNADIAVGNIIGSNIFNILLILSVSSLIQPLVFSVEFNGSLYILMGGTIFLFIAMFTGEKKKLDRWEAILLFLAFIAYTVYLLL